MIDGKTETLSRGIDSKWFPCLAGERYNSFLIIHTINHPKRNTLHISAYVIYSQKYFDGSLICQSHGINNFHLSVNFIILSRLKTLVIAIGKKSDQATTNPIRKGSNCAFYNVSSSLSYIKST